MPRTGTGKTVTLHHTSEAITSAGDVVLYVNSIETLIEGLGELLLSVAGVVGEAH